MSILEVKDAEYKLNELREQFQSVLGDYQNNPRAWIIRANPVWGSAETVNSIAIFDTKEQAEAYWNQSLLPEDEKGNRHQKTPDGIGRSFRPDSLLWDYNPEAWIGVETISPLLPGCDTESVEENPAPPTGDVPEMKGYKPLPPRYGVDYEVGQGPENGESFVNKNDAKPQRGVEGS